MTEHTDLAATTIRAKIITDTDRLTASVAWSAVETLDGDTKERFYGLLENQKPSNA